MINLRIFFAICHNLDLRTFRENNWPTNVVVGKLYVFSALFLSLLPCYDASLDPSVGMVGDNNILALKTVNLTVKCTVLETQECDCTCNCVFIRSASSLSSPPSSPTTQYSYTRWRSYSVLGAVCNIQCAVCSMY